MRQASWDQGIVGRVVLDVVAKCASAPEARAALEQDDLTRDLAGDDGVPVHGPIFGPTAAAWQ